MKDKKFSFFWKKLLVMDLGLIVILVRIFGMVWGYLSKISNNSSIFPQSTENGYPFFDSINCDMTNMLHILENILLEENNKKDFDTYNSELLFNSFLNSFKSNECSFIDHINICSDNKKCFDELKYNYVDNEQNITDLYGVNNQGKMNILNIIKLFQEKNEFHSYNKDIIEIESYYKLISGYNSYLNIKLYEQNKNNNNYKILKETTNNEDKVNNLFYTYSLLLKAYTLLYKNKLSSNITDSINYIDECLNENEDQFTNKKSILYTNEFNKNKLKELFNDELINIINCIPEFKSRFSYELDINALRTTMDILLSDRETITKKDKKIFNFFLKEFSKSIKTLFIVDVQIRQKANIFFKYQPYFIIIYICISLGTFIFLNRYFIKNRQHYTGSKILEKYKMDRYNFLYNDKHHQYLAKLQEMEEKRKNEENKNLNNNNVNNINANGINENNLDDKDKCTKEELEYIEKLAKEHKGGDFILSKK